jgi:putative sugar O-methyltransferase
VTFNKHKPETVKDLTSEFKRAAAAGDIDAIRLLQRAGADIRAETDAAFRLAARHGHLASVRYLHQNGADIRAAGNEALRQAAANGHLSVVRYLHESGVDILSDATGGEALRRAAAGGHAEVIRYLHENGTATTALSPEGRECIDAMAAEIASGPPIYQPSEFWKQVGAGHTRLLYWTGEQHFKRTVNQNFFNFIPIQPEDARRTNLDRLVAGGSRRRQAGYRMDFPDCDPGLWISWYPSYQIFKENPPRQAELYLLLVRYLYEFVLQNDPSRVLRRLEEPSLGDPIRVWRNNRLISQDLANSVWERNTILSCLPSRGRRAKLTIAELGAGYGRLGHVLLATTRCRYMVFDIPPALYLAQWYLSTLFPGKRIFRFRPFRAFAEIEAELRRADIAFFTANQLGKLPDRYFDMFINISSLHEMRPDQISNFLALMERTTRTGMYLKEFKTYCNPYDNITIDRPTYALSKEWEILLEREDILNPDFFELLLRRRV